MCGAKFRDDYKCGMAFFGVISSDFTSRTKDFSSFSLKECESIFLGLFESSEDGNVFGGDMESALTILPFVWKKSNC